MKKFIIPIFMLLPIMSAQAQTVLTEQQQLEQAQKQLEEAKKALEVAKMRAEAARIKAQADSINAVAKQAEAETKKAEAEAKKAEADAKKTSDPKPVVAKEPTTPVGGWVVPVAEQPRSTDKAMPKLANGETAKIDTKYLEGAVTTNAEGKVEFILETDANGKSAQQIYDIVYPYMQTLTQGENNISSRVALVNPQEHVIANTMDEWIVFNQSFISLDRSEFKYQLVAKISDNHLHLSLCRLIYAYEEDRSTGFKEPAENVITDKVALNKKKNDLAKLFGKFRRLTIDRKDQIFNEITTLIKE